MNLRALDTLSCVLYDCYAFYVVSEHIMSMYDGVTLFSVQIMSTYDYAVFRTNYDILCGFLTCYTYFMHFYKRLYAFYVFSYDLPPISSIAHLFS